MNLKLIGFLLSLLFSMQAIAQESFYKGDEIRALQVSIVLKTRLT